MTPPRTACLVFKTDSGEIPCAGGQVVIELAGDGASGLDRELIRNTAHAVLHYFREELGRTSVSVGEFAVALARVLRSFGVEVDTEVPPTAPGRVAETDLRQLACESGKAFELAFFPRLREEVASRLQESPRLVRFTGLRSCVKQLAGAQRWTGRCQALNDQIVEYLRQCWSENRQATPCPMVVL